MPHDTVGGGPRLRIVFMGSPDFSVPALAALIDAGNEIACVYSQPPRPAGRGQHERPCPVHAFAAARGLSVRTPKSLKDAATQAAFADLAADVAVVAAYGLILPRPVLDAPRLGCVNIHASLLPRWRGAAPIQRAIIAGDDESGITIMQMDAGLDTGDMLARQAVPITATTTASDLHDGLAALGAGMIASVLADLAAGRLTPEPQPEDGVTYADKLSRAESRLDFSLTAAELERRVRALNPWPGVWFEHAGACIKVLAAEAVDLKGTPGTVLDDGLAIACAGGALRPLRLQRPGKGAVETAAFLRGFALPAGSRIE